MSVPQTMSLPEDKQALAVLMRRHAYRCEAIYAARRLNWLLAWYYLQGYRRFDIFDPTTGQLSAHYVDEEGRMEYNSYELLFQINQVAGRIQSMDLRPQVVQEGFTLEGQRSRATGQILTDSLFSADQVREAGSSWAFLYSCLGFVGLTGHIVDHPTIGLTGDLEVIHPKELFPFPTTTQDGTKALGLMRQRWVTREYLRSVYGKKVDANLDKFEWWEVDPGEPWNDRDDQTYYGGRSGNYSYDLKEKPPKGRDTIPVIKIRELWVDGPRGTVSSYAAASGEYLFQHDDLSKLEVYQPIGVSRFFNNGTFYGAGMFDLMFSTHRQLEKLSKQLYQNILDLDRYGILVLPQGQLPAQNMLRDVGHGLRAMFWEPDPVSEGFDPFTIQPYTTGDFPGRVAQFARESMQAVNPIQDLIQEKGRVDSASGLQFLDEQITRALTCPTAGVQSAWGRVYKSATQRALQNLAVSRRALPVGSLTLDLAGAIINPVENTVSFNENRIPDLSRLSFGVRDLTPRSVTARKQEALELWKLGISQDPMAFKLFALKEGLDFAIYMDDDSGAYEMGIRAVLTLFNDGETPGQLILTPDTTRPELVLRLVMAFITSPALQVASPEVVNAFIMLRETLMQWMGLVMPEATPSLDEAAAMTAPPQGPSDQDGDEQSPQPGQRPVAAGGRGR